MIVINLWGVPSSGKSTAAAYIFYNLKENGVNCELITEVAKDLIYDENFSALSNQLYVAGNQSYRLSRLNGKVDVVITDAPLLLQSVYYRLNKLPEPDMMDIILNRINLDYENYNYLLPIPNSEEINMTGRIHDKSQLYNINCHIIEVLDRFCDGNYINISRRQSDYDDIVQFVLKEVRGVYYELSSRS